MRGNILLRLTLKIGQTHTVSKTLVRASVF